MRWLVRRWSGSRFSANPRPNTPSPACELYPTVSVGSTRIPAERALRQPRVDVRDLIRDGQLALEVRDPLIDLTSLETSYRYEGYLQREAESVARLRRQEGRVIPADFRFDGIPGLSHESVERLTQVEIDASVVEFSKQHFPEFTKPVLADKRFNLVIDDGMAFVQGTAQRFDVIIVDSTDPEGPGAVLFTHAFYSACKRCLTPGGVMVTQNGVPFLQPAELVASVGHFRKLFADGSCYVASIPTYVGGQMAMGWATDNTRLRAVPVKTIAERYASAGRFKTKYWTPEVHRAAFALPRFIAEAIERK